MSRRTKHRTGGDGWAYRGPRRSSVEPWKVVLVVGLPLVVLVWVLIYVETPMVSRWVSGWFGSDAVGVDGGSGTELEAERAARARAAEYVGRYVSIQTETEDRRIGTGDELRMEVRVALRNSGAETVSAVKARVSVRLVPSMVEAVVQTREPLADGVLLGPGDRREFTVVFEGLRARAGDEAAIRVELMEPELAV